METDDGEGQGPAHEPDGRDGGEPIERSIAPDGFSPKSERVEPVRMSDLSAAEFVRWVRERKGLDPTRLSDLPDDEPGSGTSEPDPTPDSSDPNDAHDANGSAREVNDREVNDREVNDHVSGEHEDGSELARPWREPVTPEPDVEPNRWASSWSSGSVRIGPLEAGASTVASALRSLEAAVELDDACLQVRVVDLVRVRSLLDSAILSHTREWDVRCLWATDRSKSPTARLARDANCSRATSGSLVKLARALARMPETCQALDEGIISTDHARRLAHACTDDRLEKFLLAEAGLIADAVRLAGDFAAFSTVVSYFESATDDALHDPTDPDAEPPGAKRRRLERDFRVSPLPEGWDLSGTLPAADGAIVANQLRHIYDELWAADWAEAREVHGEGACETLLRRTVAQRRADALVEMAKRSTGYRPGSAVSKPLITVLVDFRELKGPVRQTFNGTVLSRREVAEWLTEADFERIVYGPKGQPVDVTSPRRFFSGAMRRAVQVRDRVCAHPTCNVDAERCHVDHVVEHTDGGPTNLDNARLLCPRHNQQRPGRGKKPPPASDSDGDGDGDGDCDCDGDSDSA